MSTPIQSLGSFPNAYRDKLAAGGWPNTSGHEDFDLLQGSLKIAAREYHLSFVLTLVYLAANLTSRVHSTQLAVDVQTDNPDLTFKVSETAAVSAALSVTGGYVGVPGTAKVYVTGPNGEKVWQDQAGIWLTK